MNESALPLVDQQRERNISRARLLARRLDSQVWLASVMAASLQEVDAVMTDQVDEAMLYRDPPRPSAAYAPLITLSRRTIKGFCSLAQRASGPYTILMCSAAEALSLRAADRLVRPLESALPEPLCFFVA